MPLPEEAGDYTAYSSLFVTVDIIKKNKRIQIIPFLSACLLQLLFSWNKTQTPMLLVSCCHSTGTCSQKVSFFFLLHFALLYIWFIVFLSCQNATTNKMFTIVGEIFSHGNGVSRPKCTPQRVGFILCDMGCT